MTPSATGGGYSGLVASNLVGEAVWSDGDAQFCSGDRRTSDFYCCSRAPGDASKYSLRERPILSHSSSNSKLSAFL